MPDRWQPVFGVGMGVAACVVLFVSVIRLASEVPSLAGLNHVSGTWIGLARDLADGVLYRPLVGDAGTGGSRYLPLHVALHALLLRLGVGPLLAGYLLTIGGAVMLGVGMYVFARLYGASPMIALAIAVASFGTTSAQFAITTIRGDLTPAALNVWGLTATATVLRAAPGSRRRVLDVGAIAFAAAILGKITTVFGVVASIGALALAHRRSEAVRMAALTAACTVTGLAAIHLASDGRAWTSLGFAPTAGMHVGDLAHAPVMMLMIARHSDPAGLALVSLALASAAATLRRWRELPMLAFGTTLTITCALFGSRGVDFNNLLDVQAIAWLLVVGHVVRGGDAARWVAACVTVLALMAIPMTLGHLQGASSLTPHYARIVAEVRVLALGGPVLTDDPMIPVLVGDRPWMLDPFYFAMLRKRDPFLEVDVLARIAAGHFRAIVLTSGRAQRIFGARLIAAARRYYVAVVTTDEFVLYRPATPRCAMRYTPKRHAWASTRAFRRSVFTRQFRVAYIIV